jgi:hypothetical protein
MQISQKEKDAVNTVTALGSQYGYGNMISHLKSAWTSMLMKNHNMTEEQASQASGGGGYSQAHHKEIMGGKG